MNPQDNRYYQSYDSSIIYSWSVSSECKTTGGNGHMRLPLPRSGPTGGRIKHAYIVKLFLNYFWFGFVYFSALQEDRDQQLMINFCLAFSGLHIMFILLCIFVDSTIEGLEITKTQCYVLAGITHYFFLVSGLFTLIQAIAVTKNKFNNRVIIIATIGWGKVQSYLSKRVYYSKYSKRKVMLNSLRTNGLLTPFLSGLWHEMFILFSQSW